jgi:hypothetical protein
MNYKKIKKYFRSEKGISLYLTVLILTILLAISLGMSRILVGQIKMVGTMGNSVIAFYAADTGTEKVLYEDKLCRPDCPAPPPCTPTPDPCPTPSPCPCPGCEGYPDACQGLLNNSSFSGSLEENGPTYQATFYNDPITCGGSPFCIRSIGIYRGIRRAIEATRE